MVNSVWAVENQQLKPHKWWSYFQRQIGRTLEEKLGGRWSSGRDSPWHTGTSADRDDYGDTFRPGSLEREGDQCSLEARTRRSRRRVEHRCSSSNPIVLGSRGRKCFRKRHRQNLRKMWRSPLKFNIRDSAIERVKNNEGRRKDYCEGFLCKCKKVRMCPSSSAISEPEPANHEIYEAAALHRPPGHWGSCASTPHLPHPSEMATCGSILDVGQPYHITPRTTHHGLHVVISTKITRCVDIVCLVRPVHQLIEMTTAIRSDPARWRERGISAVLKPEREGADVE
ncbi:hypothetical protein J6590_029067 [Homalodisca vitripennis]|nr:hypothetical protein J6590_029067 [Homalodisca vitripennis]